LWFFRFRGTPPAGFFSHLPVWLPSADRSNRYLNHFVDNEKNSPFSPVKRWNPIFDRFSPTVFAIIS